MSGEFRLDLHVHSKYSRDSSAELEAIAKVAVDTGLRGFALTDHNTTRGHGGLADLQSRYRGYLFVPGVEVSTREGHLLAYGIAEAPPVGLPVAEAIEWVSQRSGVAILPHAFRRSHGVGRVIAEQARVPALEGRNGHNSELANAHAELVAAQRGLGSTGGSDAHLAREVGSCDTVFTDSVESVDDILDQLRRGRCHGEGHSLTSFGRIRVSVRSALLRIGRGFRPI